jgi:hypothetical protein
MLTPANPEGERRDQIAESLFKLWWKVRSCLPPPLGLALLPQSLQGQLPCENGEGLCMYEKVVWFLASRRGGGLVLDLEKARTTLNLSRREPMEPAGHVRL